MTNTFWLASGLAVAFGLAALSAGCDDKKGDTASATGATESVTAPLQASAAPTPSASAVAEAPSAAPSASASTAISAAVVASAAPTGSANAAPAVKEYDCGGKGQKACPMQGWMKSVMANAVASNDGDKIAAALATVAGKTPPGFGNWASMASSGAAKAKAGDIDGAKASCKVCHDAYKESYKKTMRDRPF